MGCGDCENLSHSITVDYGYPYFIFLLQTCVNVQSMHKILVSSLKCLAFSAQDLRLLVL